MKKWQKVCIVIAAVIIIISGVGYGVYKVSLEPKLENTLEKAQKILNDENVQAEIDNFVNEMIESGILQDSDIQGYINSKLQQSENSVDNEAVSPDGSESSEGDIGDGASGTGTPSSSSASGKPSGSSASGKPSSGSASGKPSSGSASSKPSGGGAYGGSAGNSGGFSGGWENPNYAGQTKPSSSTKLIDRVKEAMTSEEFSFAMSMYGKLDVGYITSNIESDRAGVKQYVTSTLTSSEISRCVEIYGKYSYLLRD